MRIFTHHRAQERGFTLLLAILVSSLLLAIGLAISNIILKEILLSSSGRESQFAFYAADSGAECALFWDIKAKAFATSSATAISCNSQLLGSVGGQGYDVPSTFTLDFAPEPYCAKVSVTKSASPERTNIESRGYNTCNTSNPRRVERAIKVRY
jgi:Tfp pilus assembly protein PilX